MSEVTKGHTSLVIAHRLSTIQDADKIIVLQQGEIAEQGSHQQLLAANGLYAQMWRIQQQQRGEG
jgi:ATP-binding cassette subfamily B protein